MTAETDLTHVVSFSGGLGSWAAAKRVAAKYGTDNLILLFADTRMEDEDLYRFIDEAAANVGGKFVRIAEGRNPWHVFFDERFLGNSLRDPCSKILKRNFIDKWFKDNCDPAKTICYTGIDWSEVHRHDRLKAKRAADGWTYEAPLCDAPYVSKQEIKDLLRAEGIKVPRLYDMGFAHNNCGGFCIKAGKGHYARLLREMPKRYARHENMEQALRTFLGKPVSILTDKVIEKTGEVVSDVVSETIAKKVPLSLKDFRIRVETTGYRNFDMNDIGGCGCGSE